jgi:hypothetical protein
MGDLPCPAEALTKEDRDLNQLSSIIWLSRHECRHYG